MPKTEAAGNPPSNNGNGKVVAAGDFSDKIREIGDRIANLSMKDAKELSDYLADVHGIEPTKTPQFKGPDPEWNKDPEEQVEFDVILDGFDSSKKISVIKVIRVMMQMGLKESKEFVEGVPSTVKEGCDKLMAEETKKTLVEAGGEVSIK